MRGYEGIFFLIPVLRESEGGVVWFCPSNNDAEVINRSLLGRLCCKPSTSWVIFGRNRQGFPMALLMAVPTLHQR